VGPGPHLGLLFLVLQEIRFIRLLISAFISIYFLTLIVNSLSNARHPTGVSMPVLFLAFAGHLSPLSSRGRFPCLLRPVRDEILIRLQSNGSSLYRFAFVIRIITGGLRGVKDVNPSNCKQPSFSGVGAAAEQSFLPLLEPLQWTNRLLLRHR